MKTIRQKITSDTGMVLTDCHVQNSVEFVALIPKNAHVIAVRVNGVTLDNYALNGNLSYPKGVYHDEQTVVALVKFPEHVSNEELYRLASVSELNDFEVEYVETYTAEI